MDFDIKQTKTTAYYDRTKGSINGFFTLQTVFNGQIVKAFKRLPARSGQIKKANESWSYGSPIPFSVEIAPKIYKLWLRGQYQPGQWAGHAGIGEFWQISTEDDKVTILSGQGKKLAVGVHPENRFPGSLACVVLVNETNRQRTAILEARDWAKELSKHFEYIDLIVL